jgi:hypothetical protein
MDNLVYILKSVKNKNKLYEALLKKSNDKNRQKYTKIS